MKNLILSFVVICLFVEIGYSQLPKGDRTLAWQIDMAENNDYFSAFGYGTDACMESVHLFFKWTDIEPDTATFNTLFMDEFLNSMEGFYPTFGVDVELQIAPTNTGVNEVPSELTGLSFSDPLVINRFKILLDTVFARIPSVTLSALNIGNETDLNFGTNATQYNEFKVFLDSVTNYAKDLYFNLHGTDLKVGTTFTHHGLVDNATANLCKSVNDGLDVVTVTYYPLNGDFTMKPPSVVSTDFDDLVAEYPDPNQPIYFAECGYPSSTFCNSSESLQAEFWTEVFNAWDTHEENIKYMTIFKSTDWSAATVNQLGQYYGVQDTIFKEYLRTLGVRTWEGDGTNKEAYEIIKCELDARDWCVEASCSAEIIENDVDKTLSVYPNPSSSDVNIIFSHDSNNTYSFVLYNSQGEIARVIEGTDSSFVLKRKTLKSGLYFFELVQGDDVVQRGKLIFE